jgi:uncharacterized protein (TIGR02145 family)
MINVPDYKILKKIGSGGMGDVYLAEHEKLAKKVAIKSLHKNLASDTSFRERFSKEAKIHSKLDHPNIVKLLDYKERKDGLFLIMEYVDGKQLDEYIKKVTGPIPEKELTALFMQVLDAISYAHEAGLVHRDIKPSNIMIDKKGKIKVLDFGIAKMQEEEKGLTKTGVQIGTAAYMSPEQVDAKKVDKLSDIYSLGVTLFHMAVGKSPYSDDTNSFRIQEKIMREPFPIASEVYPWVSNKLEAIIFKATQKDKKDRYKSCEEFKKDLELLLEKNSKIETTNSGKKGGKKKIILSSILFLLFSLGFVYFLMNSEHKPKTDLVNDVIITDTVVEVIPEELDDIDSRKIPLQTALEIYKEKFNKEPDYGLYIDLQNSNLSKYSLSSSFYAARNEGKLNEALAYADRMINLEAREFVNKLPHNPNLIESRSKIYYLLGEYQKALKDINYAIELLNGHTYAGAIIRRNAFLYHKAHIQYMNTSYNGAIQTIKLVIELNYWFSESQKVDIFLLKGKCLNALGKYDQSCHQFKKTIDLSKCDNCKSEQTAKEYLENYCRSDLAMIKSTVIVELEDEGAEGEEKAMINTAHSCGNFIEHDGYNYSTVQIGEQCWFSENCRYLPEVSPSSSSSTTDPYYYVYDYEGIDVEAAQATINYATYGVLYNWPAVMTEGICPIGWHIPSDEEFTELTDFLGGEGVAGAVMKSISGWYDGGNGFNTSGWTSLPGGMYSNGKFFNSGGSGFWWSASESGSYSWQRRLNGDNLYDDVSRTAYTRDRGFSARCLQD